MQILDVHTHILPPEIIGAQSDYMDRDRWFGTLYASPRARFAEAEHLVASMDTAGIAAAVTFGFAFADTLVCRLCNDYVLEAASRWPGRLIPFCVVNPLDGEPALAEIERCLEMGAQGIGELMPDGQGYALDDPCLDPLMQLASAAAVPVMIHVNEPVGHVYPGKGIMGPGEGYRLAERFSDVRLILSHWGGGLPFYELMPSAKASLVNVYYDTAASPYLYEDRVFADVARWAADKILFGSDYPLLSQDRFVQRLRRLDWDADTAQKVLYRNAAELLGLSATMRLE